MQTKGLQDCTLTLIVVLVLVILRIWQVQKKLIQNVSRFIKCDIWSGNWGPKLNNKGNEHGFRVCHGNMAMAMNNDVKV